jgi:hypothetical protein
LPDTSFGSSSLNGARASGGFGILLFWVDLLTRLVNIVERRDAVEVSFDDADLAETLRNGRELQKRHGVVRAKKIRQRLQDLKAAETLAVMRSLPAAATSCTVTGLGSCHSTSITLTGCCSGPSATPDPGWVAGWTGRRSAR